MRTSPRDLVALALGIAATACASAPAGIPPGARPGVAHVVDNAVVHVEKSETVADFRRLVPERGVRFALPEVRLERVSAGVPWPRGLEWVDGELVVLARGRHRRAGGVDHAIVDSAGCLFRVDPELSEPVVPGQLASHAVAGNAEILARSLDGPFLLPDRAKDPVDDTLMDRPYCTLIYDAPSRNLFICGYSGVDLPAKRFRKNATDSIHRFDLRSGGWYSVELHDAGVVPPEELGYVVSNAYYPHHDPERNAPPHGWLNGPDGGCVAGSYLYCVSKDNHLVVQYDLAEVRRDPDAGPPPSRPVLGPFATVRTPGGVARVELLGPSAAVARDGYLYLGYRTSSVVVRFPIDDAGGLVTPAVGELVAVFEPWDAERGRSANLIDLAFNSRGELFVSCATEGRVWRVGRPDPERPFYGDDSGERATTAPPFVDMAAMTGRRTNVGNLVFDDRDRLYLCAGNYDTDSDKIAGVVYRAIEGPALDG